jgi:hypothetical protein
MPKKITPIIPEKLLDELHLNAIEMLVAKDVLFLGFTVNETEKKHNYPSSKIFPLCDKIKKKLLNDLEAPEYRKARVINVIVNNKQTGEQKTIAIKTSSVKNIISTARVKNATPGSKKTDKVRLEFVSSKKGEKSTFYLTPYKLDIALELINKHLYRNQIIFRLNNGK